MGKSGGFYAVAIGRQTGVFRKWGEAEVLVKGFAGACYKKFATQSEADAFLATHGTGVRGNAERSVMAEEMTAAPATRKRARSAEDAQPVKDASISPPETKRRASLQDKSDDPSHAGKPKGPFWYAVAKGRKPGVYDKWDDAKVQIEGLFSAKYKKFATKAEAEAFVKDHLEATTPQTGDPDPKRPDSLVAFCDGSALQNGRFGCQAGYACIFPHNPTWNIARKLVEERATNNRAEYLAALEAMKRANQEEPSGQEPLYIFSDSMLLIRSMTEWVANWQKKNWIKADGNPVLNRDLLELLVKERGSRRIIWRHVKAHTGKTDWQSKWNDVADHAARNAAAGWEPTSSA